MGFYSVIARARDVITIPDRMIALDRGVNTFNIQTDDIDGVVEALKAEGVEVDAVHQLDGLEPVDPKESLLLPGESMEVLRELEGGTAEKA